MWSGLLSTPQTLPYKPSWEWHLTNVDSSWKSCFWLLKLTDLSPMSLKFVARLISGKETQLNSKFLKGQITVAMLYDSWVLSRGRWLGTQLVTLCFEHIPSLRKGFQLSCFMILIPNQTNQTCWSPCCFFAFFELSFFIGSLQNMSLLFLQLLLPHPF